jgi:HD-GYP domain-containing protein (c-di-GMP phosphodiesterase class II)
VTPRGRIGRLSHRLAQELGLPEDEAEAIGHAAVAHDIGKIAVPDRILLKRGELDDAERHEIQRHALVGAAILSRLTDEGHPARRDDRPDPPRALGRLGIPARTHR